MNFIDTKIDRPFKWLIYLVISELIVIVSALLIYYNIIQDILLSLTLGIVIALIVISFIIRKMDIKVE